MRRHLLRLLLAGGPVAFLIIPFALRETLQPSRVAGRFLVSIAASAMDQTREVARVARIWSDPSS
jgi:hypothetical protein